ncbi:family 10 glycosylhydrolase [Aquiflexum sp.]|uniref:family 10 glycosylhydrolase n=1 Tax=Aquiflexum sp. TaxID=1872584 RepID=UPI003593E0E8
MSLSKVSIPTNNTFRYILGIWLFLLSSLVPFSGWSQTPDWPDSIPWWKANNLRVIQTNLPAYEAATLDPDSLVADLIHFSANTLIINAGGIMAFYPTKLEYHYTNPYMKENMLGDVIRKCHENGIRVIVRFDFSRAHKSVFQKHPDWFYISPQGEHITNEDLYTISINAPYEQEQLFNIVEEVIDLYPIDGVFINMPGYQTRNPYIGKYYGIDQNPYDKKRFAEYSGGLSLPLEEDRNDPVFRKYEEFKKFTADDLIRRLNDLVKSKNEQIAICTYSEDHVDIIRHESQTNTLPYWPYNASDNVSNTKHSYPDHIVSNASIQQISFQSRYNAVEPAEVAIRLYENIANGSGLDLSLMGDFRDYEDERNFDVFQRIYAHHKKIEPYFGNYTSAAQIAVIAPGSWPSGDAAHEYRGIQLMLKEAHIQYDIIENSQIGNLEESLNKYRLIILPEIVNLDSASLEALARIVNNGTNIIATNRSLSDHPEVLWEMFGAKIKELNHDGAGFYLQTVNKDLFTRFEKQQLLFWKFNLGLYDFEGSDESQLPIFTPGIPGPPEIIGGHEATSFYAVGIKNHNQSNAVLMPINLGKLYYLHGYEQHKNILLDLIDHVFPEVDQLVRTNAHPRLEVILQQYAQNKPENFGKDVNDGVILHLVNLTGFSGNTYFNPLPVFDTEFNILTEFKPKRIWSMVSEKDIPFTFDEGRVLFKVDKLGEFDGIVMER